MLEKEGSCLYIYMLKKSIDTIMFNIFSNLFKNLSLHLHPTFKKLRELHSDPFQRRIFKK